MFQKLKHIILSLMVMVLVFTLIPFEGQAADSGELSGISFTYTSGSGDTKTATPVTVSGNQVVLQSYSKSSSWVTLSSPDVKQAYFTVKNNTGSKAIISFQIGQSNVHASTLGSFVKIKKVDGSTWATGTLNAGATTTITVSAASYSRLAPSTAKLTLSNFTVQTIQNNVSMTVNYDSSMGSVK